MKIGDKLIMTVKGHLLIQYLAKETRAYNHKEELRKLIERLTISKS